MATPFLVAVLIILQIINLVRYVDQINRDVTSFLESIRFAEFTRSFHNAGMGKSFNELSEAFNAVITDFQQVRAEKEEHFHYLQGIIQNIDIGIIVYQQNGDIEVINRAAKKMFQISGIGNIKELDRVSDTLVNILFKICPGENELIKVSTSDDIYQLAIYATELRIKGEIITIASIKNIQTVLENQEIESWQKLIRVLTHEIMNSITPISSLTSTADCLLMNYMAEKNISEEDSEDLEDIRGAVQTINKRSKGLIHFVDTYRNLTKIPKPNFKVAPIIQILDNIMKLFSDEAKSKKIKLTLDINPDNIVINADAQLIEQVIINLVKNSIQALSGQPDAKIELRAFYNQRSRPTIQVIDNGKGIVKEVLDKIFIPFFTTKTTGTGIGLSLSRQILRLHNGSINGRSEPGKETVFTLTF